MSKLAMIGTFTSKDGKAEETEAALASMVEARRTNPAWRTTRIRGEGNTYWFFALMTDRASMAQHGPTDAMQARPTRSGHSRQPRRRCR